MRHYFGMTGIKANIKKDSPRILGKLLSQNRPTDFLNLDLTDYRYRRLLSRIMLEAISDALYNPNYFIKQHPLVKAHHRPTNADSRNVLEWFANPLNEPFSFKYICEHLDLSDTKIKNFIDVERSKLETLNRNQMEKYTQEYFLLNEDNSI